MTKTRTLIVALIVTVALAGCTSAQTDRLVAGLVNFNRGLAAVDQTIKQINTTLYGQCTGYVEIASSINDLAGQCSKAASYTTVANAVILNYCQTEAIAQNGGIAASIAVTAKNVSAAKSTLAANKAACAAGSG
jgi:Mrp family chromosome partitioning ATPase